MMAQQAKMLTVNPDKLSSIIGILMLKRDLIPKSDLLSSMCAQMHGSCTHTVKYGFQKLTVL